MKIYKKYLIHFEMFDNKDALYIVYAYNNPKSFYTRIELFAKFAKLKHSYTSFRINLNYENI